MQYIGNTDTRRTHTLSEQDSKTQPCGRRPDSVLLHINQRPSNSYVFTHHTKHKIK
jgi:hypothetical protein